MQNRSAMIVVRILLHTSLLEYVHHSEITGVERHAVAALAAIPLTSLFCPP